MENPSLGHLFEDINQKLVKYNINTINNQSYFIYLRNVGTCFFT